MRDYKMLEQVQSWDFENYNVGGSALATALLEGYEIVQVFEVSSDVERHARGYTYNVFLRRTPASKVLYGTNNKT